ncbi:aminotransferase class III-fold pyridoxal phosphate-dependent enzyme [Roseiconus nitratireducens]|uniref:Aminotransferase class III-fold pyridoxal phosphate-dependent enzyme n=1 Tax=Roseiconus nitratireducens TaxID=2605748 RepID=A0A5M6D472_9BACT|nr:aminotransferase class III-fold pyridoxal phosphate-dependent enzyme [Roseiconus nitratireducens]KAA5542294.1 aminotransferase class III-fold pyridoxal phosphate-dependent enzyme [Roseiconus nitratireducens]
MTEPSEPESMLPTEDVAPTSGSSIEEDLPWIDGCAGRHSFFPAGDQAIVAEMMESVRAGGGDPLRDRFLPDQFRDDRELSERLIRWIADRPSPVGNGVTQSMLFASPDQALEAAITWARRRDPSAFKIVSLVGSDHGRTAACRTASGRPELHDGYGPMVAGFAHVGAGDIDRLRQVVDETVAAVILSPVNLVDGVVALDPELLSAARQTCDQHGALLIVDESTLCIGATGEPLTFSSLASSRSTLASRGGAGEIADDEVPQPIAADVLIASAGLFAGLPGALMLSGSQGFAAPEHPPSEPIWADPTLSVTRSAVLATLSEMIRRDSLAKVAERAEGFARDLAQTISECSLVRDLSVCGLTLAVQTDVPAADLVRLARQHSLSLQPIDPTGFLLQPPPSLNDQGCRRLIDRIAGVLRDAERGMATETPASHSDETNPQAQADHEIADQEVNAEADGVAEADRAVESASADPTE